MCGIPAHPGKMGENIRPMEDRTADWAHKLEPTAGNQEPRPETRTLPTGTNRLAPISQRAGRFRWNGARSVSPGVGCNKASLEWAQTLPRGPPIADKRAACALVK